MRLLIADDDTTSRLLLQRLAVRWGYEPILASDGDAAWAILEQAHRPRLAVLDWLMPGLDGVEICQRLALEGSSRFVYVVLLTSLNSSENLNEAFDSGAHEFLSKPVRPGELKRRLAVGQRIISYDEELAHQHDRREQLEVQLRHAQKLEAVGRLAAGVAHEINTPVQYVGDSLYFLREASEDLWELIDTLREALEASPEGPCQELAQRLRLAEEQADVDFLRQAIPEAHARAQQGIDRVTEIVRAMKDFARPAHKQRVATDLNRAVHSALVVATHEYKYAADARLEAGQLPLVPCFPGELGQVLLNLLVNAAHAIQDVAGDSNQRGEIVVRTWSEEEHAVISISDTGAGIPTELADRVFDPFFTTKEVGRGSGQGLTIAHNIIVSKHGGRLEFDTHPGQGTTFFIRLPLSPGPLEGQP